MESLESQRCVLVPACEDDRDDTFALYQNEVVRKYLGGTIERTVFDNMFDRLLVDGASSNWIIRLKAGKIFVGVISIGPHHDGKDMELSYQILPEFWGEGLARECLAALLSYARKELRLSSIVAETQAANIASRDLLEKAGFKAERTLIRFGEKQFIYRKPLTELLLIFTGLPASGKTSLARTLAQELNLEFIDKDDFLEAMFETEDCGGIDERRHLSRLSDQTFKKAVIAAPRAAVVSFWRGPSVAESSGTSVDWVFELPAEIIEIYCECPAEIAALRFTSRKRHPSHFDNTRTLEVLRKSFDALVCDGPLGLGKLIRVNTASQIDMAQVVNSIRSKTSNLL